MYTQKNVRKKREEERESMWGIEKGGSKNEHTQNTNFVLLCSIEFYYIH